jgi:hypothetical protein
VCQVRPNLLVAPELARSLIARARVGPHLVRRSVRTIAGLPADCIEVTGAGRPTACATDGGVLALLDGVSPGGVVRHVELIRYSPTAAPDAFTLPPGAEVRAEVPDELSRGTRRITRHAEKRPQ